MFYYQQEYEILPMSTNGNKIVSRDFKEKNIVFRAEVITLVDEDFYRDGENSGYDLTYETKMIIITKEGEDYLFHFYLGGCVSTFSRWYRKNMNDFAKYEYDDGYETSLSSLADKSGSYNYINHLEYLHSIATMSGIEPLFKKIKTLINRENRFLRKKKKVDDKAYEEYKKTTEYYKSNFSYVLGQLNRVTHCPFSNCKKFEINFNKIKNDSGKIYSNESRNNLCQECFQKNIWIF